MIERKKADIDILPPNGEPILSVLIAEDNKRVYRLMGDDYIELHFANDCAIHIPVGSYVDDELFGRFYVTEEQMPEYDTSTGGYRYELKMDAWYKVWGMKLMMLTSKDIATKVLFRKETEWHLCASLREQLREYMCNLQCLGYAEGADFLSNDNDLDKYIEIGEEVTTAQQALLVNYSSTSLLTTLDTFAKLWECEWWVTGDERSFCIHMGKCVYGEELPLSLEEFTDEEGNTVKSNVEDMKPNRDTSTRGDKLFFFGSTDNIPNTYRKHIQLYATDVEVNSFTNNIAYFSGKKNLDDAEPADINSENLPGEFLIKFEGSDTLSAETAMTKDGVTSIRVASDFRTANAQYATTPIEVTRMVRFRILLERYTQGDTPALHDVIDLSEEQYNPYDPSDEYIYRLKVEAEQVWELYDDTSGTFRNVLAYPIQLTTQEWNMYAKYLSDGTVNVRDDETSNLAGNTEFFLGKYSYYRVYMWIYDGETKSDTIGEHIMSGFLHLNDGEAATPKTIQDAAYKYPVEVGFGEFETAPLMGEYGRFCDSRDCNRKLPSLFLDGRVYEPDSDETYSYGLITDENGLAEWNTLLADDPQGESQYGYHVVNGDITDYQYTGFSMTAEEWAEVARVSGAPLSLRNGKIYLDNDIEMIVSDDGKFLKNKERQLSSRRLSDGCFLSREVSAVQAVMSERHKYKYSLQEGEENTYIEERDLADYDAEEKNLSYYIQNSLDQSEDGFKTRNYIALSKKITVGSESAAVMKVDGQTVRLRVKICTDVPFLTLSCKMKYYAGLVFGNKILHKAYPTMPDIRVFERTISGIEWQFTKQNGYYYGETDVEIGAAESMEHDILPQEREWGFHLAFAVRLHDIIFMDESGNEVEVFNRGSDSDLVIDVVDDSPFTMSYQGKYSLGGTFKAMVDWDNQKFKFTEDQVSSELFGEGTLFYIISDYDYAVPYKYFTSVYDDPASIKSIGERRLMLPVWDEEHFHKYGEELYGMRYDRTNGYIYNRDNTLAYKDGYVIPKDFIGAENSLSLRELSVADDSIYPDGKLLVNLVKTTQEKTKQEVENDEDLTWSWEQYHLQLRRPGETGIFAFDQKYILSDGEALKIRFLIPEDMKAYVGHGISTEDFEKIKAQCLLAGMQFEVEFNKAKTIDGVKYNYMFSPKRNSDFGGMLPNDTLKPQALDPCVLVGWNVKAMAALDLIAEAEYKLLDRAFEYYQALTEGDFTFNCTMMSDFLFDLYGGYVNLASNEPALLKESQDKYIAVKNGYTVYALPQLGQKVCIHYQALANNAKHTRVIGMELKMDKPYDSPVLICGETEAYSRIKKIEKTLNILTT